MEFKILPPQLKYQKSMEIQSLSEESEVKKSNRKRLKSSKLDRSQFEKLQRRKGSNYSMLTYLQNKKAKSPKHSVESLQMRQALNPRESSFLRALLYSTKRLNEMYKESEEETLIGKKRPRPFSPDELKRSKAREIKKFLKRNHFERSNFYSNIKGNICIYFDEKKKQLENFQEKMKKRRMESTMKKKKDFMKYFND